jgi:hypothetical protein
MICKTDKITTALGKAEVKLSGYHLYRPREITGKGQGCVTLRKFLF